MENFLNALSGLGLFLLGMIIMTEGLRAIAGEKIRSALMRFTRSPATGAMSGAVGTAILQSSSATTVAAVGFVGAGLLTFQQALGIIFGANIGTTLKGWLVALLGFKLQIGTLVLPLIFIGVLMHLLGKEKSKNIGLALAGFGLIFVGIGMLQTGLLGLQDFISFENFPADTWLGRLKLLFIGILFTIITQSSSAGVAATLTALYAGMIDFEQAAALIIGMDVGTTVTALMASIGGSIGARRTGYSHVIYNFMTGTGALLLITPYTLAVKTIAPNFLINNAEIALVAFHTLFNTLGVILILPFTHYFASMMERLVPEVKPIYTKNLDIQLIKQPDAALNVVQNSIQTEIKELLSYTQAVASQTRELEDFRKRDLKDGLKETQRYLDLIELQESQTGWQKIVKLIHALDHMNRLYDRCYEDKERAVTAANTAELKPYLKILTDNIKQISQLSNDENWHDAAELSAKTATEIHQFAQQYRNKIMEDIGSGHLDIIEGTKQLEAIRWLRRVSKHINKMMLYSARSINN